MRDFVAILWGAVLGAWATLLGWSAAGGSRPPALLSIAGSFYVAACVESGRRRAGGA